MQFIWLKINVAIEAYDLSEIAIENAKRSAEESKAEKVVFKAENIFDLDLRSKKFMYGRSLSPSSVCQIHASLICQTNSGWLNCYR